MPGALRCLSPRRVAILSLLPGAALLTGFAAALLGVCGPFVDVANDAFCPFVLGVFYTGITTGTTPATYDPSSNVNRTQMVTFVSRSVDGVSRRHSSKTHRQVFWAPQTGALGNVSVGKAPVYCRSSGRKVYVSNLNGDTVTVLRASDGKVMKTLTGYQRPYGSVFAKGRMYHVGNKTPGLFYEYDPAGVANTPTLVSSTLGGNPRGVAWDGERFWTANEGPPGSVSIITPGATIPWTTTNVTSGFSAPHGLTFNGSNVWVTDFTAGTLLKLDSNGAILQTIPVGTNPRFPMWDGINFWVPNFGSASVTIVRGSGSGLTTLTGNGLGFPTSIAHNGDVVYVSNHAADTVSRFKMADTSPRGAFSTGAGSQPFGLCTDSFRRIWMLLATDDAVLLD